MGSGGIVPLILNLGMKWWPVVSFKNRLLVKDRTPVTTGQETVPKVLN
jgi:hypothetical protein